MCINFCQITTTILKYLFKSTSCLFQACSNESAQTFYICSHIISIVHLWVVKSKPEIELLKFLGNTNIEVLTKVLVIYFNFCAISECFNEFNLFSFDIRVWENQRPNVWVIILQHIAIKWDSSYIPRFWKKKRNTLKATWLNTIAYDLSFKTIVYEMCLGVCFVLFLILQEENKCCRYCWGLFWDKRHYAEFQLLQSWKTQGLPLWFRVSFGVCLWDV